MSKTWILYRLHVGLCDTWERLWKVSVGLIVIFSDINILHGLQNFDIDNSIYDINHYQCSSDSDESDSWK
jgi:hypothetical protein